MATAVASPAPSRATSARTSAAELAAGIWQAPLVPVALALTLGIVLDRNAGIPLPLSLGMVLVALAAAVATLSGRQAGLSFLYLLGAVAAFGAAYHHGWRNAFPPDDIGNLAPDDPRPARLRGVLADEPTPQRQPAGDPLQSVPRPDSQVLVLEVTHVHDRRDWRPASGYVRLVLAGNPVDPRAGEARAQLPALHVGDEVEVVGRLQKPQPPANPGEFDYESYLLDQRIRAVVGVRKTPDGVTLRARGSPWSLSRGLALLRGWGKRTLQEAIPPEYAGLAVALLLGDGTLMYRSDWDQYRRTGVIHVLAISGQHLVVLAAFLWLVVRLLGVRRRRAAGIVALFLLGYSLLTGGRPPVMRAAVMVCVLALGMVLRRPVLRANSFALAWVVVALLKPTDLYDPGGQLSFLAVAVLYWGTSRWLRFEQDPLERVVDQSRPTWARLLRWAGGAVGIAYLVTGLIWLAEVPLVAGLYNTVPLAGLFLGPPLGLLTSIALLAGFLLLLAAALFWPLVPVLAWVVTGSLAGCEALVRWMDSVPWLCWYVGEIPAWWLWGFYVGFLMALLLEPLRRRWCEASLAGLAWLCLGLLVGWFRAGPAELRCTFLAVGHGGCTVLETPDGRVLLYDAGSIGGPDVTQRQVAPFLWSRGIRRVDEVFISHADLDHFNGLIGLLQRFAVGQVTLTPTFRRKNLDGVRLTLKALRERSIPVRWVCAGDTLRSGDLTLHVLHPPVSGPGGRENYRSLVLWVRHAGHSILLTGDLEGPGMQQVLERAPERVDVLMAPHHGSRAANTPALVQKVRPQVVVSCQGPPRGATRPPDPGMAGGAPFLGTWPHGAVTVTSRPGRLVVETYRTGQRLVLPLR